MTGLMNMDKRRYASAMQQSVVLTIGELTDIMRRVGKIVVMEYDKVQGGEMISRRCAEKRYGRTIISRLEEIGAIVSHKTAKDRCVVQRFNVTEIEAAIAADIIDDNIMPAVESKYVDNDKVYIYGIKELATVYCCSYAKAKMLRSKLAAACVKRGRHVVVDLNKAQKIIPLPSPGR